MAVFCDLIKELAVLKESNGYRKVVNIISWNGAEPKLDIHEWTPENHCTKKGFTLSDEEAKLLLNTLQDYFESKEKPAKEESTEQDKAEPEDLPF